MKPLNRPMFKYGGPIKEGIMSGIREPKKNGGLSKQFNTGLVGDERYPKTHGREHHALFIPPMLMAGLGIAGRALARPFGQMATRAVQRTFAGPNKRFYEPAGFSKNVQEKFFQPNKFGDYLIKSPEGRFVKNIVSGSGKAGKFIKGAATSTAKSPLALGSIVYYGGGALLPDGTPDPNDPKNIKPAEEGSVTGTTKSSESGGTTVVSEEKLEQMNKDRIQKNKERYYKLMGLDNMKKDAVYDSLIDASKIISEEGADLKGSIKSGTLQNRIIQAISGQLDKSASLKKQIDAAVLKGEIEKDIKANDPSAKLAAEYTKKRIDLVDKQLAGGDLDDIAGEYRKQGLSLKGQSLFAEASRKGIDTKGILPTENVDKFMNDNPTLTEADFVNVYQEQLVEAGKNKLPAGDYVVGGRIITIGDDGKAKAFLY
jgi:hypothetical protein